MCYSIIIPVYKVENTLCRCVESAVAACRTEDEIILIDDGSPDRSGEIVDELAEKYGMIRTVHKANGGLSDARNTGLRMARGNYVLFLDSDDYLDPEGFADLRSNMSQFPDMQVYYCDILRIQQGAYHRMTRRNIEYGRVYDGATFFREELSSGKFRAMAQSGIYHREFLLKNELFFKKGLLHEDEEWSPRVLLAAQQVVNLKTSLYRYEIHSGSITQREDKTANARDLLTICREHRILCDRLTDPTLQRFWRRYIAKLYIRAASIEIRNGLRKEIEEEYIQHTWITAKDRLRFGLFLYFPGFYARYVD